MSETVRDQSNRDYVTLIIRLLVTSDGDLLHGEAMSVDQIALGRFRDWDGLTAMVRAWLIRRNRAS